MVVAEVAGIFSTKQRVSQSPLCLVSRLLWLPVYKSTHGRKKVCNGLQKKDSGEKLIGVDPMNAGNGRRERIRMDTVNFQFPERLFLLIDFHTNCIKVKSPKGFLSFTLATTLAA